MSREFADPVFGIYGTRASGHACAAGSIINFSESLFTARHLAPSHSFREGSIMQDVQAALTAVMSLLPAGVRYPPELLSRFDGRAPFDREHLGYLCNGGEAGAYNQWLTLLARHSGAGRIVELGNRYGVSTIALYCGLKNTQELISIDVVQDQRYLPDQVRNDSRVRLVYGDCLNLSIFGLHNVTVPCNIDILWTDTVHCYSQLKDEFNVYEPLLSDEAIIAIDDINLNDKRRFFDEAPFAKFDFTRHCHVSGFGVLHYVRPPENRGESIDARESQCHPEMVAPASSYRWLRASTRCLRILQTEMAQSQCCLPWCSHSRCLSKRFDTRRLPAVGVGSASETPQ